jgi:hypothetical protein
VAKDFCTRNMTRSGGALSNPLVNKLDKLDYPSNLSGVIFWLS